MKFVPVNLGNICHLVTDGKHGDCKNEENSGFFFLSAKDVKEDRLNYENARQITREDFLETHKRTRLEPLDIVMSNSGTIGRMAIVKNKELASRTTFQKSVAVIKPNNEKVDSVWLYYFLKNSEKGLLGASSGTAQKNLLLRDLRAFEVSMPPLETQQRIADILSSYDDLIEVNRRRIKLLEDSARLLYQEWFVHLRFPEHERVPVVDGVPDGWKMSTIGAIGDVITGKTPLTSNASFHGGEIPFIKTPDMHGKSLIIETQDSLSQAGGNSQKNKFLPKRTILVSCIGTVGIVSMNARVAQTNQQINSVIPNNPIARYFLLFAISDFKPKLEAIGGGVTMNNVNKAKFEKMEIVLPEHDLLEKFHKFAEPVFDQVEKLLEANQKLQQARDLLLPRLMRGELLS